LVPAKLSDRIAVEMQTQLPQWPSETLLGIAQGFSHLPLDLDTFLTQPATPPE